MKNLIYLLPLLWLISSCSSGSAAGAGDGQGNGGGGFCVTVSGGSTNTSSIAQGCTGCTIDNRDNAIDDSLNTAAVMHVGSGSSGQLALRVNAQAGVVFASGSTAGFVIDGADNSALPHVRTLLDGAEQETSQLSQMTEVNGGQTRVYFTTSAQFDSIEAVLPGDGAPAPVNPERSISVYEFCVN